MENYTEKAERISKQYHSNLEYIEKYKNVLQRETDVTFRKKENIKLLDMYPALEIGNVMKTINK